jgi:HAD superfamily hydrolase (TIGR01509 family)
VIAAVLFDCDGVLVDSEVLAQEVEIEILGNVGLHYDRLEFNTRFVGTSDATFWEALEADGWARLGRSITNELREPLRDRVRQAFTERLTEVPGARGAIATVKHPRAVASSSGTADLRMKLERVGHWTYFAPHVYSADHVPHAKPAPDLFLHAARMLNVAAADCLVIEDSINGVRAGRAANMTVWGFVGGGHHDEGSGDRLRSAGAERVVASWDEAKTLFESL